MNIKIFRFFLIFLLALGLASTTFAQGRQTGSISGTIVDVEGIPLPGVTITATSEALMGSKTYVSKDTGSYRFPTLPPGIYTIKCELPGFKTVTRGEIIVRVGMAITINITMEMTTIEEEITVVAPSPVVDMQTTKISVHYGTEFLVSLPMSRDLMGIQDSIPGAVSDGKPHRRTSSILGGTVRSQLYQLDGVPMNDPSTFYSIANINVDVYEEIEFGIGALPAEVGQTDSVVINIVTKSGGNKFSGGVAGYYTGESFSQDLLTKEQIQALDVNAPGKYSDYKDGSLDFGGPIIKDRLWFFLSGRRLTWDKANPETHDVRIAKIAFANPGMFTAEELQHYDLRHEEWMGFAKLTFQLTKNIRYMGMLHYNHYYEPVYFNWTGNDASFACTAVWDNENTYATTHQLNWILDQNTFLDIRGTYLHRHFPILARPEYAGNYRTYDKEEKIYWGARTYLDDYIRTKALASVSATRFQDNFLGASHEMKVGAEFENTIYMRDRFMNGNPWGTWWMDFNARNPYYYSTSKREGRLYLRPYGLKTGVMKAYDNTRRFSAFAQDSIVKGKLAINLGLRFDYGYQYEPEQVREELRYSMGPEFLNPEVDPLAFQDMLVDQYHQEIGPISGLDALTIPYKRVVEFTTLSPRVGLVYDIFGDGKTALKLSFSRYYEPIWSAKYNAGQLFGAGTLQWTWTDINANKLMDLPPTDTYKLRSYKDQEPEFMFYVDDLKAPYMNEFIAGIEHELARDFKLGLQFVYKVNKNIVEDVDRFNGYDSNAVDDQGRPIWLPYEVVDPGWDGEFGTDDDQNLTIYGLADYASTPTYHGINPPEAKREYMAGVLTFDKRMSNKWQLKGSILYSAFKGNAQPMYSETEGQSGLFDNPNTLINSYGRIGFDHPLQIKLIGTYIFPYDFVITAYLQHRSGSAWARTFDRIYFPDDYPVQVSYYSSIRAEAQGTRRNAPITTIDLRAEKSFSLGGHKKLSFYADIFNVAGRSGINVNRNPNARLKDYKDPPEYKLSSTYGDITSCYGVRSVRLGFRLRF
ncbi:hypothetical protein ES705_12715 [subsurface metagenome]